MESHSVQEMGETVVTVLGMWDGIQVHSSFHGDVQEQEYKDLLTNTFTQADHERDMKNWGVKYSYPQCVFYTHTWVSFFVGPGRVSHGPHH